MNSIASHFKLVSDEIYISELFIRNLASEELGQTSLKTLKEKRKILKEDERVLEMNRKRCQDSLNEIKEKLREESLRTLEAPLIAFKQKVINDSVTCPIDIRNYVKSENFSAITMKDSLLSKDLLKHEGALNRELTESGIDPDDFLEQFDNFNQSS